MKPAAFDYVAPASVDEALACLAQREGAKVLAGGQSLVPMLALRLAAPAWLVDVNRIAELSGVHLAASGELVIGAATRQRTLERSALIAKANPLLAAVMPWIAHVQIRNRGTLGGSLAHADPAAELPGVCLACDAVLTLQSRRARREVAAAQFFRGMFETALAADELLTQVRFPAWPARRAHAFLEVARRHGDFAICGIALTADREAQGHIGDCRIVAIGVEDRPVRLAAAERMLAGSKGDPAAIEAAAKAASAGLQARQDLHASAEYRLELVEVLTRRALLRALR
jgi:carbon-monoxide dehydrogenase medium subunit